MFRPMVRTKQALSQEVCLEILRQEPRGILSLLGENGYPYGVPMDYWYNNADGCLYFHSGPSGHKIDAIAHCNKASFCVMDSGFRKDGEWALNICSVIVFGKIQLVEDQTAAIDLTRQLSLKYTSDVNFIEQEIRNYGSEVLCFRLVPEHISGKITKES